MNSTNEQERDLLLRAMTLTPATLNEEQRTVEATIVTSERQMGFDWKRGLVDDELLLDGLEIPEQIPLMRDHSRSLDGMVGSIRGLRREGEAVRGILNFAVLDGDMEATRLWTLVRRGDLRDVSGGMRILEATFIEPGQSAVIAGRTYSASNRVLRVITRARLFEGSLVPVGNDPRATIRSMAAGAAEGVGQMEQNTAVAPPAAQSGVDGVAQERQRVVALRELAAGEECLRSLEQQAITEGWSVERASRAFLEIVRGARQAPVVNAPNVITPATPSRDEQVRILTAGLMHRTGMGEHIIDRRASDARRAQQEQVAERGYAYRNLSLIDLCREALRVEGRETPVDRDEIIRSAVATVALQSISTNSFSARMMLSYSEGADSTQGWVAEVDVPNFKPNERYGLEGYTSLKRLPRTGTAHSGTTSDTAESYKVYRYAMRGMFDEQDILDDNLNVFQELPTQVGVAAARVKPDLVYSILLGNPTLAATSRQLFNATDGNNVGGALAAATLRDAWAAMRKQKLANGETADITPQYLIVGPDLDMLARELVTSQQLIIAGTAGTVTERGSRNVIADLGLQIRSDGRLANGVTDPVTGTRQSGSATTWFLSAAANRARTIEVGYLAGTGRRPVIRTSVVSEGRWGIAWDVKHDVGAAPLDFRGLNRGNT